MKIKKIEGSFGLSYKYNKKEMKKICPHINIGLYNRCYDGEYSETIYLYCNECKIIFEINIEIN